MSKCGWRTSADDLAFFLAQVPEAVWQAAVEVVTIARAQNFALTADGNLDLTANDHSGFFAFVRQHRRSRIAAKSVRFVQHLQLAPRAAPADLA
jgi:hypothetical protein